MKKILQVILSIAVIAVIAIVVSISIGRKSNNTSTSMTMPSSSPSANSHASVVTNKVSITNFSFSPASITVKKGTTVTWTNNDSTAHTVTADSNNEFDSGTLNHGKSFSHTFSIAGTFAYHCTFHSNMHGTVTVTQ